MRLKAIIYEPNKIVRSYNMNIGTIPEKKIVSFTLANQELKMWYLFIGVLTYLYLFPFFKK